MKIFGKVILGIVAVFFGMMIFNYLNSIGVHKAVGEQGDVAYLNNDFSFFKDRFEYHQDTPLLEKHVEFMLDDEYIERKELGEVEDKTVKFDLYIYHSANVSKDKGNYLTVLVKDLIVPKELEEAPYLETIFKYNAYRPRKNEAINIVKIGKENWYLQWIKITLDNINSFMLIHDDLLLYEHDLTEPFLRAEDHDLIHKIEKKDAAYCVVEGLSEGEEELTMADRESTEGLELKEYLIDFKLRLDGNLSKKEELYLSGEFNDWAIADERYKLTKNSEEVFSTKINYDSYYDEVYYTITTKDGRCALDSEGNVKYYKYEFLNKDSTMADYDIVKSGIVKFNKYDYYKWIGISVYVLIIGSIITTIYLVKAHKERKENVYTSFADTKQEKETEDSSKEL